VGLPTSPTIQRPGLTGIGHHRADEPTNQVVKGKPWPPSAVNASPTLPRPRSPSCPAQGAPFYPPLPSSGLHFRQPHLRSTAIPRPARRRSSKTPGKLQENSGTTTAPADVPARLQENSGTTPPFSPAIAILWPSLPSAPSSINDDPETRPPTFQQDFRKTQAPHPRAPHPRHHTPARLQENSGTTPPVRTSYWHRGGGPPEVEGVLGPELPPLDSATH
jgi:hypothetical protein